MSIAENAGGRVGVLLGEVAELIDKKKAIEASLKEANKALARAEAEAVTAMKEAGLDGCRAAGKSWYYREFVGLTVPSANREKIVEAARAAGRPDLIGVSTASLKAVLMEAWREGGKTTGSIAEGTAFEGLVEEYHDVRLGHTTVNG